MINIKVGKFFSLFNTNTGLFVLRIGVGSVFITTGFLKLLNFGMTLGTFAALGFSPFWVYLSVAFELLGGIAILLGIYTRIAAVLLTVMMIVATYVVHSDFEIALAPITLFFATFSLLLSGGVHTLPSGSYFHRLIQTRVYLCFVLE